MDRKRGITSAAGGKRPARLRALLAAAGATVTSNDHDGTLLTVTGRTAADIGDLAAAHGLAIHELAPQHASLEQAFMELTKNAVEYRSATTPGAPADGRSAA